MASVKVYVVAGVDPKGRRYEVARCLTRSLANEYTTHKAPNNVFHVAVEEILVDQDSLHYTHGGKVGY